VSDFFNKYVVAKVSRDNSWIGVTLYLDFDESSGFMCREHRFKIANFHFGLMRDNNVEELFGYDCDKKFEDYSKVLEGFAKEAVSEAQEKCLDEDEQDAYDEDGEENEISYQHVKCFKCQNRFGKRLMENVVDEGTEI